MTRRKLEAARAGVTRPTPSEVLRFGRGFDRYKKEDAQPVRTLEVQGDYLQRARKAREMLRSMTPDQALEIIEFHKKLTMFEAVAKAKTEGWLIVPNDVIDRILIFTKKEREKYRHTWVGTLVIHAAPDKPFGNEIIFRWKHGAVDYSIKFTVPERFREETNCALAICHPDFELVDLGNNEHELGVIDESKLHLIMGFPRKSNLYYCYGEFGIPAGDVIGGSRRNYLIRHLWRTDDTYIGFLIRFIDYDLTQVVSTYFPPSKSFGVAVINIGETTKGES